MTDNFDEIVAIEDFGTINLSGDDVMAVAIITHVFDACVKSGMVETTERTISGINDLIDKVDNLVYEASGIHLWGPVPTPA